MEGFVVNESNRTVFRLQKHIIPGGKLSLEDAYMIVGAESKKLKKGIPFAKWLKQHFFKESFWRFYKSDGVSFSFDNRPKDTSIQDLLEQKKKETEEKFFKHAKGSGQKFYGSNVNPIKGVEITPANIIESEPDRAKKLIAACKDRKVLKYALALSKQRARKEQHMLALIKRLEEVY